MFFLLFISLFSVDNALLSLGLIMVRFNNDRIKHEVFHTVSLNIRVMRVGSDNVRHIHNNSIALNGQESAYVV